MSCLQRVAADICQVLFISHTITLQCISEEYLWHIWPNTTVTSGVENTVYFF